MKRIFTEEEILSEGFEKAVFAGGCFWCTEAVFEKVKGVKSVISGYTGGSTKNPSYNEVCSGKTGHAEAVQIIFNPTECNYETLLKIHFKTHDPTTLNRQGNDRGTQYRSAVYFTNDIQEKTVRRFVAKLEEEKFYQDKIVTEIEPLGVFYSAENYHQDYFKNNPDQAYCIFVVAKKVEKLEQLFPDVLQ